MTSNQNPEPTPADSAAVTTPAKKSKVRRNLILAGSAASLVGIGSTLAANINLNSGENVEFGQGVASTTACDEDGFNINPVTSYDNDLSIFRLDYVEVTGLNLTPVGTGWDDGDLNGLYPDTATAKTAHPGEYFDGVANEWKRTCDGVVLDFKAYTDDLDYSLSTRDGYFSDNSSTISSPIGWFQYQGNLYNNNNTGDFGFAVVIDVDDNNQDFTSNFALGDHNWYGIEDYTNWGSLNTSTPALSSFTFGATSEWQRPNAASISKIAVSSMKMFPANYSEYDSGLGHNPAN